jgi:hypothetical protein
MMHLHVVSSWGFGELERGSGDVIHEQFTSGNSKQEVAVQTCLGRLSNIAV